MPTVPSEKETWSYNIPDMQRKHVFDMVPRNKPAAPAGEKRVIAAGTNAKSVPRERTEEKEARLSAPKTRKPMVAGKKSHPFRWLVLFLIIVGAIIGAMTWNAKADVEVTPKSDEVGVNSSFSAGAPAGDLAYRVMTIEKDATTTVPASSKQKVESKATGTVMIYNLYSAAPYRLIKNTRLESSSGLIFKLSDTVVVPGRKNTNGTTTPGSAEASVFADSSGQEYNIGYADFTIPGFKGSPQYAAFYARSKTSIGGGWSGEKSIASQADISAAVSKLESNMSSEIADEASSEIPDGFISAKGLSVISFRARRHAGRRKWKRSSADKGDISHSAIREERPGKRGDPQIWTEESDAFRGRRN